MKIEFDPNNAAEVTKVLALIHSQGGAAPVAPAAPAAPVAPVAPVPSSPAPAAPAAAAPAAAAPAPVAAPASAAPAAGGDLLAQVKAKVNELLAGKPGFTVANVGAIQQKHGSSNFKSATPEQLTAILADLNAV